MPDLGWPEILIIAILVFALFGYKKLPDATRSVARSLRIFKAESKAARDEDRPAIAPTPTPPPVPTPPEATAPQTEPVAGPASGEPVGGPPAGSDTR